MKKRRQANESSLLAWGAHLIEQQKKRRKATVVWLHHQRTSLDAGKTPIVPCTGMCGPCTFGEAETYGGNW